MGEDDRRVTRAQAQASSWSTYLGLPNPYGRNARAIRSPLTSPATSPANLRSPGLEQQFVFPSPENSQQPSSLDQHVSIMADAALTNLSTALSGLSVSSRKPDLPAFDKSSIEIWIRRVESAFIRAGITQANEKFAFVESKFAVNEDPQIDKFLFGEPTSDNWKLFCDYLKKRYGKTIRQKASAVLEPISLDGRTPLQYLARLQQNCDGVTLDDVIKEICVRQLPTDVQQIICKATESMTATEMMTYAESFFNPDGSRVIKKPTAVNSVENRPNTSNTPPTSFTAAFADNNNNDDVSGDINAVRGRVQSSNRGGFRNNNGFRSQSRGRQSFGNNNNNNGFANNNGRFNNNNSNNNQNRQNDPTLCFYHNKFGEKAKRCDIGCAKANQGNGKSPRQM